MLSGPMFRAETIRKLLDSSTAFDQSYRGKKMSLKDSQTIGLRGFPLLNIDPIATSYDELKPTCCHLALDKPTRLPGDYIFASNNIDDVGALKPVSAPLLPVQHPNREYNIHLGKMGKTEKYLADNPLESEFSVIGDIEELTKRAIAYTKFLAQKYPDLHIFSDHVQMKRSVLGVDVYSNNASFVILNQVMNNFQGVWGSEEMFVRAIMGYEKTMTDLFDKFMKDFNPRIVGVQEATLDYFVSYMRMLRNISPPSGMPTWLCFYCHTLLEGSAILVDETYVDLGWLNNPTTCWFSKEPNGDLFIGHQSYSCQTGSPYDLLMRSGVPMREGKNQNNVWAVCGHPGRTFSAVVIKLKGKSILMLNIHSPNPAPDVNVAHAVPYESLGRDAEFRKTGWKRQHEWLNYLLNGRDDPSTDPVITKIRAAYKGVCENRLLMTGDFNDASRVYLGDDDVDIMTLPSPFQASPSPLHMAPPLYPL